MSTVSVKCKNCGTMFEARMADRKRGWARFCSKSCKAKKQEQCTGQHTAYLHRQRVRDANGCMTPRDFQREYGGTPVFNERGEYEGFLSGSFDNTAHQNSGDDA